MHTESKAGITGLQRGTVNIASTGNASIRMPIVSNGVSIVSTVNETGRGMDTVSTKRVVVEAMERATVSATQSVSTEKGILQLLKDQENTVSTASIVRTVSLRRGRLGLKQHVMGSLTKRTLGRMTRRG